MAKVIVVGDGPGGLSAALFLAKNGQDVVVYGKNETAMHFALLFNYLGHEEIHGSELQAIGRSQVEKFGGTVTSAHVIGIASSDTSFTITLEDGTSDTAEYLIMTEGRKPELAMAMGVATDDKDRAIVTDRYGRSSIDRVYVVGRSAYPHRSQAIISAGAGATAALDILARERGEDIQDWDSPPKE